MEILHLLSIKEMGLHCPIRRTAFAICCFVRRRFFYYFFFILVLFSSITILIHHIIYIFCSGFYRRYVDDTLTIMPSVSAASNFLQVLNACHPSVSFIMEVENDGMLPFVGIQLLNKSTSINRKVFTKPTNKGLLLHYDSHVDARYKHCPVRTMLERAYRLSSSWDFFTRLENVFSNLHYPKNHINQIVN